MMRLWNSNEMTEWHAVGTGKVFWVISKGVVMTRLSSVTLMHTITERLWVAGCGAMAAVLDSFAKLGKATVISIMSVRPSVRMEQIDSKWADFLEIWYLAFFPRKSVEEIQGSSKPDKNSRQWYTWRTAGNDIPEEQQAMIYLKKGRHWYTWRTAGTDIPEEQQALIYLNSRHWYTWRTAGAHIPVEQQALIPLKNSRHSYTCRTAGTDIPEEQHALIYL